MVSNALNPRKYTEGFRDVDFVLGGGAIEPKWEPLGFSAI